MTLLVLAALFQLDPRWDFDRRLGLVRVGVEGACLAIDDDTLTPWIPVLVVRPEERSSRTFAAVVQGPAGSCPGTPSFQAAYRLQFVSSGPPPGILGAAVGAFSIVVDRQGSIAFRLAPAPTPHLLRFTRCGTPEGVRIRVLSGHPIPGHEVWSRLIPDSKGQVAPCVPYR